MLTVPSTHRTGCCQGSALHPPSFIINTLEQGPGPVLSLSPMDCPSVIFIYIYSSTQCSSVEPESLSSSTTWQTACFPSWAAFFSLHPRCRMSKMKFSVVPSGSGQLSFPTPPEHRRLLCSVPFCRAIVIHLSPSRPPSSPCPPARVRPWLDHTGWLPETADLSPRPVTFPLQPPIALRHLLNKVLVS